MIAGFAEIGEPLEDTVRREVMEEVGLPVKNIRFYKSQPWSFSSSLLSGFYCDLDTDDETVTLQEDELGEGTWFDRENLPPGRVGHLPHPRDDRALPPGPPCNLLFLKKSRQKNFLRSSASPLRFKGQDPDLSLFLYIEPFVNAV